MRLFSKLFFALVLSSGLLVAAGAAHAALSVKSVGGFHVGGKEVVLKGLPIGEIVFSKGAPPMKMDPNGQFEAGQMYVQYVTLENPTAKYPLLLWHGGGLTGVTYEDTPDGRPGWQSFFLKAGHDVYTSDAMERGRASWAKYPEIFTSPPVFRPLSEVWVNFRFGPKYDESPAGRVAYPGQQFPVENLSQFAKQFVPRWTDTDARIQAAYDSMVSEKFPSGCVILAHSQGGAFAVNAALHNPDKVRAVILIEPSGAPDPDKTDLSPLKNIPFLMIWGDYIKGNDNIASWNKNAVNTLYPKFKKALEDKGGSFTWIDLPDKGIKGNSHMLMMDKNSDVVAQVIQDWMQSKGLMR